MFLAVRALMSIEWPEGNDGRYYWQHCGWQDSDDFPNLAQMRLQTIINLKLLYTEQVQFHSTRWYVPGTETVFTSDTYLVPQFGGQAPQDRFNILICSRWRMHGEDGSYTYHLHRQPIGTDYLIDGVWSDLGFMQQQARMNTFIGFGKWRTSTGALIDTGQVGQLPVMWQLRHGTKRRRRRGWLS